MAKGRLNEECILVSTDIEDKKAWKECFKVEGVQLPTGYYIGASATTGDLSDAHDLLSMRLYELDLPDDVSMDETRRKHFIIENTTELSKEFH